MTTLSRRLFVVLLLSECIALLAVILVLASAEPSRRWPLVALIAGTAVLIAIVLIPAVRTTAYRQCVPYNPRGDFHYDLSKMGGASAVVTLDDHGFDWPKIDGQFDTAILLFRPPQTGAAGGAIQAWKFNVAAQLGRKIMNAASRAKGFWT